MSSDQRPQKRNEHYSRRPSIDELLTAARGRWLDIIDAAGIPASLLDGKGHPCPRCGGRDRFAAWRDVAERGAVHCRRCFTKGTDPKPGDGLASLRWLLDIDTGDACAWLADYLGMTGNPATRHEPRPVVRSIRLERLPDVAPETFGELAERCHRAMLPEWWQRLADRLNLPDSVLKRLRVGWFDDRKATTWPMVDASGNVIGIRLRCLETNRKWSVRGGRAGLFVPTMPEVAPGRLFIAEGPTDTAAVLSMGLPVIGRASCTGSVAMECETVRRIKPRECVLIADRDEAGRRGAESLAVALLTCCQSVRVIVPPEPFGDAREWIAQGGTAADIIAAVDTAKPRSLRINSGVTS